MYVNGEPTTQMTFLCDATLKFGRFDLLFNLVLLLEPRVQTNSQKCLSCFFFFFFVSNEFMTIFCPFFVSSYCCNILSQALKLYLEICWCMIKTVP